MKLSIKFYKTAGITLVIMGIAFLGYYQSNPTGHNIELYIRSLGALCGLAGIGTLIYSNEQRNKKNKALNK